MKDMIKLEFLLFMCFNMSIRHSLDPTVYPLSDESVAKHSCSHCSRTIDKFCQTHHLQCENGEFQRDAGNHRRFGFFPEGCHSCLILPK